MRVYIPIVSSDFLVDQLPLSPLYSPRYPDGADNDTKEICDDDAQTEAALSSLERLRKYPTHNALLRIIIAADIRDETVRDVHVLDDSTSVLRVETASITWADVCAILVDDDEANESVRAVIGADTQEEADQAVSALWEFGLQWYDISEKNMLADRWNKIH